MLKDHYSNVYWQEDDKLLSKPLSYVTGDEVILPNHMCSSCYQDGQVGKWCEDC